MPYKQMLRQGETSPYLLTDTRWVQENYQQLWILYNVGLLLVWRQQVIGIGITLHEVVLDAHRTAAKSDEPMYPILVMLGSKPPYYNIYPKVAPN